MPIKARAVRLLPQPLSPTSPNTSDSSILKDRPLTTFIGFAEVLNEMSSEFIPSSDTASYCSFFLKSWMYVFASFRSGFCFSAFSHSSNASAVSPLV